MSKPRRKGAAGPPSPFTLAVAALVDTLRGELDVTQEEIAEAIGKTQPYVSARVRLELPWSSNDFDGLAEIFGMDPFEFVARAAEFADAAQARARERQPG